MLGVLNWLKNFWVGAAQLVGQEIAQVTEWALHALANLIFGQFRSESGAWKRYYVSNRYFIDYLIYYVYANNKAHHYTLNIRIPKVVSWAAGRFSVLGALIAALRRLLALAVAALERLIKATAAAVIRWVIRSVLKPLLAAAAWLKANLLKWGYTAWWWITHLPNLAEALIFHLATSLEKHAWELAGLLGKFTFALILRNARRIALLAEDIVTAVL